MTLSENVHKFAELSQRIVVERSVIQTYEEIKNNTKTTEISVENFNRIVSSSSTHADLCSDAEIIGIPAASTLLCSTFAADSNGDICHGGAEDIVTTKMLNIAEGDDGENDADQQVEVQVVEVNGTGGGGADAATMFSTKCSTTKSTMSVIKSSMTTATNGGVTSCSSSSNIAESTVIDNNKPNKGSEALINNSKLNEVTVQRPLKPQSEMDFLVPYNIINNYFSVGVVSKRFFFLVFNLTFT